MSIFVLAKYFKTSAYKQAFSRYWFSNRHWSLALKNKTTRLLNSQKRSPSIKLVAIAKDEAAYIPEWIFHHLYFGFDAIQVYYNRCTDQTKDVLHIISKQHPVSFINADSIFQQYKNVGQAQTYIRASHTSRFEGFDYVMFLDIDEFWTPADLSSKIQEVIKPLVGNQVISFDSRNKIESGEPFSPAIEKKLKLEHTDHVKSALCKTVKPKKMNPHSVVDGGLSRVLADGTEFPNSDDSYAILADSFTKLEKPQSFILHRIYRSPMEYIATLGRGNPHDDEKQAFILKDNRAGYNDEHFDQEVNLNLDAFSNYRNFMNTNISNKNLIRILNNARNLVENRHCETLESIRNAKTEDYQLILQALKGTSVHEVESILSDIKNRVKHFAH